MRYITRGSLLLLLCAVTPLAAVDSPYTAEVLNRAKKTLEGANIPVSPSGLIQYFQERTRRAADNEQIQKLITNLGHRSFRVREQAEKKLLKLGECAKGALARAVRADDAEVRRRATVILRKIDLSQTGEVEQAAIHVLCASLDEKAGDALFDFIPHITQKDTHHEVLIGLLYLASQNKLSVSRKKLLSDPVAEKRAAMGLILGRFGSPSEQKEAYRQVREDRDPTVRLFCAHGLLLRGEKSVIPSLIGLLETAPLAIARQAEDLLFAVAGDHGPEKTVTHDKSSRAQCKAEWDRWWEKQGEKLKVAVEKESLLALGVKASARRSLMRFLQAVPKKDFVTIQRVITFPFEIGGFQVLQKWEEMKLLLGSAQSKNITVTKMSFISVDQYRGKQKRRDPLMKRGNSVFQNLPSGQFRAMEVRYRQGKGAETSSRVLFRLVKGRLKICGFE